jgi:glutathione S-transferase
MTMEFDDTNRQSAAATTGLTLYYFPACPFCIIVLDVIEDLDLSIGLRNIHADPRWRQELIEGGGRRTVPCLRIEDDGRGVKWMYESRHIIHYLQERFGA